MLIYVGEKNVAQYMAYGPEISFSFLPSSSFLGGGGGPLASFPIFFFFLKILSSSAFLSTVQLLEVLKHHKKPCLSISESVDIAPDTLSFSTPFLGIIEEKNINAYVLICQHQDHLLLQGSSLHILVKPLRHLLPLVLSTEQE